MSAKLQGLLIHCKRYIGSRHNRIFDWKIATYANLPSGICSAAVKQLST